MKKAQVVKIYEVVREVLPEATVAWLQESELVVDEVTGEVVEALHGVHCAPGGALGELEVFALAAAYLHRAPLEELEEVPGPLDELLLEVLRGYGSRAALREQCQWGESRAAAAMLHMATRWRRREAAPAWCYGEVWRALSEDRGYEPYGVAMLRELERAHLER